MTKKISWADVVRYGKKPSGVKRKQGNDE